MRAARAAMAAIGIVLIGACASPVDGVATAPVPPAPPVVAPAPEAADALGRVLPTADELSRTLGIRAGGLMGQLVTGGAEMLLQGVDRATANPLECVGATHRLQQLVYGPSPVRSVASRPWAGGDLDGPARSAFFGVVKLASADAAREFFAATVEDWRDCDGHTLRLAQPGGDTESLSKITDVVLDGRVVSAVVLSDAGRGGPETIARALGVASDCIVDVEVDLEVGQEVGPEGSSVGGGSGSGAVDAVGIANLMLDKISAAA